MLLPEGRVSLAAWLAVLGSLPLLTGCDRYVRVQKEMTWECAQEHQTPGYTEAQLVRFRYLEDPAYEEQTSGRSLCDQLKASGKKVVIVEFEAWGNSLRGLHGFREVAVDGKPIVDAGGWGSSGATGATGPHPLTPVFE
jgi:hypothetical protein